MTCEDAAYDADDADFQRWYFGGSPPESDSWPRHAFEDALHGARPGRDPVPQTGAQSQAHFEADGPGSVSMA